MEELKNLIDAIVSMEWDLFQAVNESGPRAVCQDDRPTFEGMRRGQFQAWPPEACASYLEDLQHAMLHGRNLVREKYIHMMKHALPHRYEALSKTIPVPDDEVVQLAQEISDRLLMQAETLQSEFPCVCGAGRPLRSSKDSSEIVSIETYQIGEMLACSAKTLQVLRAHLLNLERKGQSLARNILENSVRHYGFKSLEEAETATRTRAERTIKS
jgi:hypothetical protein